MKMLSALLTLVFLNGCSSGGNPFFVPGKTCKDDIEVKADLSSGDSLSKNKLQKSTLDVSQLPAGKYEYNGASIYYESTLNDKRSIIRAEHGIETEAQKAAKAKKKNLTGKNEDRLAAECVYNPDFSKGFIYSIEGVSSLEILNDKSSTVNTKLYSLKFGTAGKAVKPTDFFEFTEGDVNDNNVPGKPQEQYPKTANVFMYKSTDADKPEHYEIRALEDRGDYSILVITRFVRKNL